MPNLIVNDLFMVQPMASFSGYMTYMQYALGTPKGGVQGDFNEVTQDPFVWAPMTEERSNYTGERIVEAVAEADPTTGVSKVAWGPMKMPVEDTRAVAERYAIRPGVEPNDYEPRYDWAPKFLDDYNNVVEGGTFNADGTYVAPEGATKIAYVHDNQVIPQEKLPTLVARMQGIALQARARRIAIQYSQFAAFQS